MNRRALLASVPATLAVGCLGDSPSGADTSDPQTTAVGADGTATDDSADETPTPSTGPGTIRVENETDSRVDVRIELFADDGDDSAFLGYVLVEPGSTATEAYTTAGTGAYQAVATLPTLGERDVNWTATETWSVPSTDDPGTVVVRVTGSNLVVTVE